MMRMEAEAILLSGRDICHRSWVTLRIRGVVDLARIRNGQCPLLDAHRIRPLGRVESGWIDQGVVKATLVFDRSSAGRRAFDMAGREETLGISCGVDFADFLVEDREGYEVEIEDAEAAARDPNLVLVAMRTQIVEVSLVPVPSDPGACITRVFGGDLLDVQRRMLVRHRNMLVDRDRGEHQPPSGDDFDEDPLRLRMPPKGLIQFTEPGPIL
jgi:hypothetical protein